MSGWLAHCLAAWLAGWLACWRGPPGEIRGGEVTRNEVGHVEAGGRLRGAEGRNARFFFNELLKISREGERKGLVGWLREGNWGRGKRNKGLVKDVRD